MTGRELIEWIKEHNAEDLPIEIQYEDEERCYFGVRECKPEIILAKQRVPYDYLKYYKRVLI